MDSSNPWGWTWVERRPRGIRALPLRALGIVWWLLGLGSWPLLGSRLGTRLQWWRGLEGRTLASGLVSVLVADLAGARLVLVSHSFSWYGAGRGYFRNVNISNTHITNINNVTNNYYNNRNAGGFYGRTASDARYATTGGLTAVSPKYFGARALGSRKRG